jgi:rhomboid protease GluP
MLAEANFKPKVTIFLLSVNILVYIGTSIVGKNFLETDFIVLLKIGQYNQAVLFQGWYWQLLTSMFVHVNLPHLIMNMFFLFILGYRSEEFFQVTEYLSIYLASGLAGNLLTLLLPIETVSAGASGAIFGIFGASVIYMRKALGQSIFASLIYSFMFLLLSVSEGVNLFAHLGGLVTGLAIGYFLAKNRKIRY